MDAEAPPSDAGLHLRSVRVLRGPNPWRLAPVVACELAPAVLPADASDLLARRLREALPGLPSAAHGPPREAAGLPRLLGDVALHLQARAGAPGSFLEVAPSGGEGAGGALVVLGFEEEEVGVASVREAAALVGACLRGEAVDPGGIVARLREVYRRARPGTTTAILLAAARGRGIPVRRTSGDSRVQLGLGRNQRRLDASMTDFTSVVATDVASDKDRTKRMLERAGLPVPRGGVAATLEEALAIAAELGPPVLLKPLDANEGRGVSGRVDGPDEVRAAWPAAAAGNRRVVVERFVGGRDHRLVVVNGRLVAAAERIPAHVVGDGRRCIRELAEEVNREPNRDPDSPRAMRAPLPLDEATERFLARRGYGLHTVPPAGERVPLRATANLSTGGTAVDRTDEVHPRNAALCELAAGVVGLDVAGLDVLTPDVSVPFPENGAVIVEVNASPGLRMHTDPDAGTPRDVPGAILDLLYPPGSEARIPVVAVTGSAGRSTAAGLVAHLLGRAGKVVGLAGADGVYLRAALLVAGHLAGDAAEVVLSHPQVDLAVLDVAPGEIVAAGLGVEDCDVGVVLDAGADRPVEGAPMDAERAPEAVIPAVVRGEGFAVLNADDPRVLRMAERTRGEVVPFSARGAESSPWLAGHLAAGGRAVLLEGWDGAEALVLRRGAGGWRVAAREEVPLARGEAGRARLPAVLAAAAVAHVLGVDPEAIREGLASFDSSPSDPPGAGIG